jgi:hypothetical protein
MEVFLKEIHQNGINDFAQGQYGIIFGSKLEALFRLIQKKGTPLETKDEKLSGVKVIKYNDKQSIGFKRTGPSDKFFPCAIKTIQLTEL